MMIPDLSNFPDLIRDLLADNIDAIEYGNPQDPGGLMSLLRIRYIKTPAGYQWAIKFLHYGAEGSGQYFHTEEPGSYDQMRDHVICYIDRYHNKPLPHRLSQTLKDRMRARYHGLCLFGLPKYKRHMEGK